jgi:hypothetical protein
MELHGTVQSGVIVLDRPQPLPEGAKVQVVVEEPEKGEPTLLGLLKHAGTLADMPSDFADYIHRTAVQRIRRSAFLG